MSRFELTGRLCLDFANTWEDRGRPQTDKLRVYGDLLAFGLETGILEQTQAEELTHRAAREPAAAEAALAANCQLRESLFRLFSTRARGGEPALADLEHLNEALHDTLPGLRVAPDGSGFTWRWSHVSLSLPTPLRPIALSAAELLTSEHLSRVRECDGRDCTWLFLDHSRNRSRRWCSMATCGNRAKVRRHYRRRRESQ